MKEDEISLFEETEEQIIDIFNEIKELSKKKPDEKINNFKLPIINKIIENANQLLGGKNKPLKEFDLFDSEIPPTNSDVTFILTHYITGMFNFRNNNSESNGRDIVWVINGKLTDIPVKHRKSDIRNRKTR